MAEPQETPAPVAPLPLRNPLLASVLAWLVPGLGHIYQGRTGKGVMFFVVIVSLFVAGDVLGHHRVVYWRRDAEEFRWPYLCQVGAGLITAPALASEPQQRFGLPALLAQFQARPLNREELDRIAIANNVPAFNDTETVAKELAAKNRHVVTIEEVDKLHQDLGRQMDIALIYTMIAGLLNYLVIFDAFAGPANWVEDQRRKAGEAKP